MVEVEVIESCAMVTVSEGRRGNLLSINTLAELHRVAGVIASSPEIRSLVLLGRGERFFVAGADIAELVALDGDGALLFARLGQSMFDKLEAMTKLVIAGVDGYCMGGGMDLLLACDFRVATERSQFAHPGARMGIITGFGGTVRLPIDVGRARARNIFLTGGKIGADEALRIGLVNRVVEDGDIRSRCLAIARRAEALPAALLRSWKAGANSAVSR